MEEMFDSYEGIPHTEKEGQVHRRALQKWLKRVGNRYHYPDYDKQSYLDYVYLRAKFSDKLFPHELKYLGRVLTLRAKKLHLIGRGVWREYEHTGHSSTLVTDNGSSNSPTQTSIPVINQDTPNQAGKEVS